MRVLVIDDGKAMQKIVARDLRPGDATRPRAFEAGAMFVVPKPLTGGDLAQHIAMARGQQARTNATIGGGETGQVAFAALHAAPVVAGAPSGAGA